MSATPCGCGTWRSHIHCSGCAKHLLPTPETDGAAAVLCKECVDD